MDLLKNVARDLVEKRLWPVAAGLVLVLAGIPVFLGGGGSSTPAAGPTAPAAVAARASTAAVVTPGERAPQRRARGGKLRNPFTQPKAPEQASGATEVPTGTASSSGSGGSVAGSAGGSAPPSGGVVTPGGPAVEETEVDPRDLYRVTLKFGPAAGTLKLRRDLVRLTPLPSVKSPFFVLMGVRDDGETARFLISSDAEARGDGVCRPRRSLCESIDLKPGDTEFFDVQTPEGKSVQYQMDLISVRRLAG
jgi:hypothetical protein